MTETALTEEQDIIHIPKQGLLDYFTRRDELLVQILEQLVRLNANTSLAGLGQIRPISLETAPEQPTGDILSSPGLDILINEVRAMRKAGYWFFPLADNVDYEYKTWTGLSIGSGKTENILILEQRGYFILGQMVANSPNLRITAEFRTPEGRIVGNATATETNGVGFTFPNPAILWCPKFDDINLIYTLAYTPTPWVPFQGLKLTVKNEDTATKTINSMSVCVIIIKDIPSTKPVQPL